MRQDQLIQVLNIQHHLIQQQAPRSIATLHGEIIQRISPEIGLSHRGTEKSIECNYYNSNIGYSDRSDHAPGAIQEPISILVSERITNSYRPNHIPLRRTLSTELHRNPNHSSNTTTHATNTGSPTTMPQKSEEREKPVGYTEVSTGTRLHAIPSLINKLRYDTSPFSIDPSTHRLSYHIRKSKETHNTLPINRLRRTRPYETGTVIKDSRPYHGSTGSSPRPIKTTIDARFTGHEFHEELNYPIPHPPIGDRSDRYLMRSNEIIECCRIIHGSSYIPLPANLYPTFTGFPIITELSTEEPPIHLPLIIPSIPQSKLSIESSKGTYPTHLSPPPYPTTNTTTNDLPTTSLISKSNKYTNLGDPIFDDPVLGSADSAFGFHLLVQ